MAADVGLVADGGDPVTAVSGPFRMVEVNLESPLLCAETIVVVKLLEDASLFGSIEEESCSGAAAKPGLGGTDGGEAVRIIFSVSG